jgi:hypothetical protein
MKVTGGRHDYRGTFAGVGRAARLRAKIHRALEPISSVRLDALLKRDATHRQKLPATRPT